MELTDADGRIVWAADYRVWGEATVRKTGTDGRAVPSHTPAPPPIEQPFRFQGQQFDEVEFPPAAIPVDQFCGLLQHGDGSIVSKRHSIGFCPCSVPVSRAIRHVTGIRPP